jgi:hypothetical protein
MQRPHKFKRRTTHRAQLTPETCCWRLQLITSANVHNDAYSHPLFPPRLRINSVSRPRAALSFSCDMPWDSMATAPGPRHNSSGVHCDELTGLVMTKREGRKGAFRWKAAVAANRDCLRVTTRFLASNTLGSSSKNVGSQPSQQTSQFTRVLSAHNPLRTARQPLFRLCAVCSVHLISDTSLPFTRPNFLVSLITAQIGSWASHCAITRLSFAAGPWPAERVRLTLCLFEIPSLNCHQRQRLTSFMRRAELRTSLRLVNFQLGFFGCPVPRASMGAVRLPK